MPDALHDEGLQSFIVPELTTTISRLDAHDYDPDDLEPIPFALLTKAYLFAVRFRLTGGLDDINEAISLLQIATHFPDSNPSLMASYTSILTNLRYGRTEDPDDLDRIIESEEALLQFEESRRHPMFLQLAVHLGIRFNKTHNVADIERVLSLSEEIIPLLSTELEVLQSWSMIRASQITRLSNMAREFPDIRQAFERVETGVLLSTDPEAIRALYRFLGQQFGFAARKSGDFTQLREIGLILATRSRPEHTRWASSFVIIFQGVPEAELDKSIALLRGLCDDTKPDDECLPTYTMALAAALYRRFLTLNKPQDIQEAIAYRKPFASLGAFLIDPMLFYSATDLHPELAEKFKMAVIAYLGEDSKEWLASIPNPPTLLQFQGKFVDLLRDKTDLSSDPLHQDIDSFYTLDGFGPHERDSHYYCHELSNQATRYSSRYESSHDQADLEQAVLYRQKVVDLLPHDHHAPHQDSHKLHLAMDVFSLHAHSKSVPVDQLRSALDLLGAVANDPQADISNRRIATRQWFQNLHMNPLYDERKHHISDMCDTWLSIVREQNWLSSSTRATLLLQRNADRETLPIIVAVFILASLRSEAGVSINRALQILESGRSLLWGQVQSLRINVDTLPAASRNLFAQLEETSRSLKCHWGLAPLPGPERLGDHIHRAHERRRQIIEEIRLIPGFEDAFQDNVELEIGVKCTTPDGPVVTLIVSPLDIPGCLAIIMTTSGHCIQPLPITLDLLKQLHDALRYFTKSRGSVRREDVDFAIMDDSSPSTSCHRAVRKKHGPLTRSVEKILECLWDNVAKPVLDRIREITSSDTKGKERADRKPPVSYSFPTQHRRYITFDNSCTKENGSGGVASGNSPLCPFTRLEFIREICVPPYPITSSRPIRRPSKHFSGLVSAPSPTVARS